MPPRSRRKKELPKHEKVLVITEDYATSCKVNEEWSGHAVLVAPELETQDCPEV